MTINDLKKLSDEEIMKDFRLTTSMSCSNFVLFDRDYKIRRYANEIEILEEFFQYRYEMYEKRKADMIKRLSQKLEYSKN